jgi:hypothetical protein
LKWFKEYLDLFKPEYHLYFELNMRGGIVYLSDSIMSYATSGMGYSGGAHGYGFKNYFVFNLKNLTRVTFDNLFKHGAKEYLADIIVERSNHKHDLESVKRNLSNFYMTNNGVGFFFDQDILDCHACGTYEYFFTFQELTSILR